MHEQADSLVEEKCNLSPLAREFVAEHDVWPLLPLPYPDRPSVSTCRSARLRLRRKRRLEVWRLACRLVDTINALDSGMVSTSQLTSPATVLCRQVKTTDARLSALQHLLRECAAYARARRDLGLTGVRNSEAVASLLKQSVDDFGYMNFLTVKQVPLEADRLVEPPTNGVIDMLEALPPEDALFYADESNVVDPVGKCEQFFKETEARYGFVGGTEDEYLKYLAREDVQHLWEWDLLANVRAIAGISAVPKKNMIDQRKLVMQVASNYMFTDPSTRAHLGMFGGASLTRCFVPSDHVAVSLCDEDAAFTYVRVPRWMTHWQGGPPVLASRAWDLLPDRLKQMISAPDTTYVSPRYLRLAMGGSHSVYILMRINLHHIGRGLLRYVQSLKLGPQETGQAEHEGELAENDSEHADISDEAWVERQRMRRQSTEVGEAGYTVAEWCMAVRMAHLETDRTFVVMHFFAGERRKNDIQEYLTLMCEARGFKLLMISVDLATDSRWDYTVPETFHEVMLLIEEGLIDVVLGGPPCSTVSRSRHVRIPNGPRPLRFRDCVWGRPDLRPWERERVEE